MRLARLTGRHKPRDADTKIHIKDHISNKMIKILLVKGFSRDASICEVKSAGNSDGKHQLGTALELCLLLRKKFGFAGTTLVVLAKLAQRIYLFCGLSVSRKKTDKNGRYIVYHDVVAVVSPFLKHDNYSGQTH